MGKFAYIMHPPEAGDIARRLPLAGHLPEKIVESICRLAPPIKVAEIKGAQSKYGRAEGCLISINLTSGQMSRLPGQLVAGRVLRAGMIAEKLGAEIVGLGGLTFLFGSAIRASSERLRAAVTSGGSYAAAAAVEGALGAAETMGHNPKNTHVVVLGASDRTGSEVSLLLSGKVKLMTLAGGEKGKLEMLAEKILYTTGMSVKISGNIPASLQSAGIVIIPPQHFVSHQLFQPGAVVCDLTRTQIWGRKIAEMRDDVLVTEGSMVQVPGDLNFGFDTGYPPGMTGASLAEAILLALEGCAGAVPQEYRAGLGGVERITSLARKHGFKMAGLKGPGGVITPECIAKIRASAVEKGFMGQDKGRQMVKNAME